MTADKNQVAPGFSFAFPGRCDTLRSLPAPHARGQEPGGE